MIPIGLIFCLTLCATVAAAETAPVGDVATGPTAEQGRVLFRSRCGGCHALDRDRTGPALRGVVGRRAGSLVGFRYSPALAGSGLTWTDAALDRWLSGPSKLVPGARMSARVAAPADRLALITYLSSLAR